MIVEASLASISSILAPAGICHNTLKLAVAPKLLEMDFPVRVRGIFQNTASPVSCGVMLEPTTRIQTTAGPVIAVYDSGGIGPSLVLVHAAGLCGAVLQPLAAHLSGHFSCVLIDERAHGESTAPSDGDFGWYGFAQDILEVVDTLGLKRPLGFGHSAGGASLLLAEERRGGTFSALYCYEPVVFPSEEPMPPGLEGNHLARRTLRRRSSFKSYDEAYRAVALKEPFSLFTEECLHLYVENGFRESSSSGIVLKCKREHESAIYAHGLAHDAFKNLPKVACPVVLACGSQDDYLGEDVQRMFEARLPDSRVEVFDGLGHFGPVQDPKRVADSIIRAFGPTN
jgi:pimeloyl-ACP methyl ester carboxylesterase